MARTAKTFNEILKFNPNHDRLGMFSTAANATSFTYRTKDPKKQYLADLAIGRAKEANAVGTGTKATAPKTNSKNTDRPQKKLKVAPKEEIPKVKAVHKIEDKIRKQNFESAALVDNDGNTLYFKDGQRSQVGFSRMECMQMKGNTLTHNHPRCSMFSDADLKCMAINGLQEIRATNRDGVTYSMKQGANFSKEKAVEFANKYDKQYVRSSFGAQKDLDERGFADRIWRGEVSQAEANQEFGRTIAKYMVEWTTKHAPDYGLEFSVEQREIKKSYMGDNIMKSDDSKEDYFVLDKDTNDLEDEAFNEWLESVKRRHVAKTFKELLQEGE